MAAVAGHASGGAILPESKTDVRFRLTIGSLDRERRDILTDFEDRAQTLGLEYETKVYTGLGHELTPEVIRDALGFFKRAMERKKELRSCSRPVSGS